jgi:hypothetical protein
MGAPDDAGRSPPVRLLTPEEREAAVARLSAAFARDVLTVTEYERRVTEVYRAPNAVALAELTADLPGAGAPKSEGTSLGPPVQTSPQILALFSSVERAGRIAIPPRLSMQSVFANIELDLRDAEFRAGVTDIEASAIFGNIEVLLPDGVTVENHGNAFLGNYSAVAPSRPTVGQPSIHIRVNGIAIFGNVEFKIGKAGTAVRRGS